MKNKFFVNRFLPIISIFLLVIFILTSSIFAASYDFICSNSNCDKVLDIYYPDNIPSISSFYLDTELSTSKHSINSVIVKYNDNYYMFVTFSYNDVHEQEEFYIDNNGRLIATIEPYNFGIYKYDGSNWSYDNWFGGRYNNGATSYAIDIFNNGEFVSSTANIYTDSSCSEIFFQNPPLGITGTLVEETQKAEIAEQMKIMIVGFLKYLIVFVVSLIAFWKGWKFLSTQLRKS